MTATHDFLNTRWTPTTQARESRSRRAFDAMVARAAALDMPEGATIADAVEGISQVANKRWAVDSTWLSRRLTAEARRGLLHLRPCVALIHVRTLWGLAQSELVVVRFPAAEGASVASKRDDELGDEDIQALFILISPSKSQGSHLHRLMTLTRLLQDPALLERWKEAKRARLPRTLTPPNSFSLRSVRSD